MSQRNIHPTAIIEPGAILGQGVTIEPYAIIKENVVLRDNVTIKAHVYIDGHTTIGEGTTIYPSASIGTKTQDLKFKGEKTFVRIGKHCEIREFVTINSSTQENSVVEVGDNCLLMAYCHVAHNCRVGNRVIMSNGATLAGHVDVGDNAIIGGITPIHQFVSIGRNSMVGGMSRITHDIPPFTLGGGIPFKYGGLNIIGLKRAGYSLQVRQELSRAFKLVFRSRLKLEESLARCEEELEPLDEVVHFIQFCKASKRGLMGQQGITREQGDQLEPQTAMQS
ncbi:acyl-ACP--UDP-N-acetylglucosamine O-acyltransferase [Estrella lausannensis]|uniref:Acyl-[acyl-carrier-protein]--UDP-N-acetylglucosamine O-acyltransferase n=1 Tax=Estrella lausannensis TaxID=483423 RepID=A0A0H5DNL6_9BACT|nr:acyl-ACP--UDP-N-acetylglucosamine O-acyltransferase [Estrella lausannensis]CRX37842.1 Acyl-[acyl-carrier-protein]--UDP-N-acetylglucosamine O-acyltransferase [Estrella lausannensis]